VMIAGSLWIACSPVDVEEDHAGAAEARRLPVR
jgi:hypothetical protein